jgi:8-oxo-dGTP pyrophosphatase MutT (NUDIX family)
VTDRGRHRGRPDDRGARHAGPVRPGSRPSAGDGDGWVRCGLGHRHWGRYGAAGVLIRDGAATRRVVLQHRAWWSHQGGTWGVPGGARDSCESALATALRESAEEAGIDPADLRPTGLSVDDHGGWAYTTVVADARKPLQPRPTGGESEDVRWVAADEVDALPLHPGFAAAWPRLRAAPPGLTLVVDAANVVGARGRGDGWWRDRAGAASRLLAALEPLADGLAAADAPADPGPLDRVLPRVVAVLEGAARAASGPDRVETVRATGSGDDTIVEVAARAAEDGTVVVVTADRGLRERLDRIGASWVGPSWLLRLLDGA